MGEQFLNIFSNVLSRKKVSSSNATPACLLYTPPISFQNMFVTNIRNTLVFKLHGVPFVFWLKPKKKARRLSTVPDASTAEFPNWKSDCQNIRIRVKHKEEGPKSAHTYVITAFRTSVQRQCTYKLSCPLPLLI